MRLGMRLVATGSAVAMAAVVAVAAPRPPAPRAPSGHDWTQFGRDVGRSSAAGDSTGIDSATVSSLRLQQVPIDGIVDASVIYLHGVSVKGATHDVFFMTTSYGKTLAVDADSGTVLWEFTPQGYADWAGSRQVTTSTPAADADRQSIYAASPDGHVQKLAISDGRALWSTAITRLPRREKIASPLTFFRGKVIAVTGGYIGDAPPYQGHVAILDAGTGHLEHVWNSLCSTRLELMDPQSCASTRSAIWGRAGAVVDTTTGNIFVATGNGPWNGSTDWSDATLELNADATQLLGNFTPTNTEDLAQSDRDVGSTSPILLGNGLVAQGGKDGTIRLLDWRAMRGDSPHRGGETQIVSTPSGGRMYTAGAVLRSGATTELFVADGNATQAWTLTDGRLVSLWKNARGGTSPVIAGGLLYVYDPDGGLRVYKPQTGALVAELPTGKGHWNSPIVADGRIALPEGDSNDHDEKGVLDIWRLR
ncbi:MAG TPA: PQQ-binding-like beta-propeller repeat protein [Gemmatimonadaceae bacterium]|nr:PQQ-binding-like beta-propeller repeat protein [Gemmatimonadaceae bacterium]